jgi:hypothetical protein
MKATPQAVEIYKKRVRSAGAAVGRALSGDGPVDIHQVAHRYARAVARWRRAVLVAHRAVPIAAVPPQTLNNQTRFPRVS